MVDPAVRWLVQLVLQLLLKALKFTTPFFISAAAQASFTPPVGPCNAAPSARQLGAYAAGMSIVLLLLHIGLEFGRKELATRCLHAVLQV